MPLQKHRCNYCAETLPAHFLPSRKNLEAFSESETNGDDEHQRQDKPTCTKLQYDTKLIAFRDVCDPGQGSHVASLVHLSYTAKNLLGENARHKVTAGAASIRVFPKSSCSSTLGQSRQYLAAKRNHGVLWEGDAALRHATRIEPIPISCRPL